MELPVITLPKVDLPFDIPVLLHPPVDHFAIVLPVVILLLEFYNLFARRKSIGAFSFLLLVLTVIVFMGAYLTGSTDGKEAYDLLTPEGQAALKAHKLLGTYLLLATGVVLFFKLLAMTGKSYFKFFFFVVLLALIAGTFEQGEHGGELVYKYGANVERVKTLDDELFDVKEELEDATDAPTEVKKEVTKEVTQEEPAPTIVTPEEKPQSANATVETLLDSAKKEMEEASQKALEKANETVEHAVEIPTTTIE
ncbi:MAG TPA: hypothetical protein ENK39_07895 [Epsilonproteobacteria bacterium]|nr:hypothetical protein [Campylobacterota bacterium]